MSEVPGWRDAHGWRPFGWHVDLPLPAGWWVEFGGVDEDGTPVVERLRRPEEP